VPLASFHVTMMGVPKPIIITTNAAIVESISRMLSVSQLLFAIIASPATNPMAPKAPIT
jgi:hypothetical protein